MGSVQWRFAHTGWLHYVPDPRRSAPQAPKGPTPAASQVPKLCIRAMGAGETAFCSAALAASWLWEVLICRYGRGIGNGCAGRYTTKCARFEHCGHTVVQV